jgi:predicted nucleic acid-binding protein
MMTSRELATLDGNVIVYTLYADTEHHRAARRLVTKDEIKSLLCTLPLKC